MAKLKRTTPPPRVVTALRGGIAELDRRIAAVGIGADERGFGPLRRLQWLRSARDAAAAQLDRVASETWGGEALRPDPMLAAMFDDLARVARGEVA